MKYIISVLMLIFMFLFLSFTFGDIVKDFKSQKGRSSTRVSKRQSRVQLNRIYYKSKWTV